MSQSEQKLAEEPKVAQIAVCYAPPRSEEVCLVECPTSTNTEQPQQRQPTPQEIRLASTLTDRGFLVKQPVAIQTDQPQQPKQEKD